MRKNIVRELKISGHEGEKQKRGETKKGRNDGILSDLNCGVKSRDGSVSSNKSHILCL